MNEVISFQMDVLDLESGDEAAARELLGEGLDVPGDDGANPIGASQSNPAQHKPTH